MEGRGRREYNLHSESENVCICHFMCKLWTVEPNHCIPVLIYID